MSDENEQAFEDITAIVDEEKFVALILQWEGESASEVQKQDEIEPEGGIFNSHPGGRDTWNFRLKKEIIK